MPKAQSCPGARTAAAGRQVYIYENARKVQGVIGLDGKHIEGTFEERKTRALSECVPKTRRQYIFINERASKSGPKDLMKPPEF